MTDEEIELMKRQLAAEQAGEGQEAETILAVTSDRIYASPLLEWAWSGDAEQLEELNP